MVQSSPKYYSNGNSWLWPSVVAGVMALLQAFSIFAYSSITAEMNRLQKEIDRLYTRTEETYTKKENTEQYRQRIAVEINASKANQDNLMTQLRRLRDDVILRDAYNGRHEALIEDLKRSNIRIDELRRDFGASYTLSDKIKELQEQIKLLQTRGWNRDNNTPKAP